MKPWRFKKIMVIAVFLVVSFSVGSAGAEQHTLGDTIDDQLDRIDGADAKVKRAVKDAVSDTLPLSAPLHDDVKTDLPVDMVLNLNKIIIPAALVLTDAARSYVFKGKPDSMMGGLRTATVHLGEGLTKAAPKIYGQLFPQIVTTNLRGQVDKAAVTIVPVAEGYKFKFVPKGLWGRKTVAQVKIKVKLYKKEDLVWERSYESPEMEEGGYSLFPEEDKQGKVASKALVNALKQSAMDIANDPAVAEAVAENEAEKDTVTCKFDGDATGVYGPVQANESKIFIIRDQAPAMISSNKKERLWAIRQDEKKDVLGLGDGSMLVWRTFPGNHAVYTYSQKGDNPGATRFYTDCKKTYYFRHNGNRSLIPINKEESESLAFMDKIGKLKICGYTVDARPAQPSINVLNQVSDQRLAYFERLVIKEMQNQSGLVAWRHSKLHAYDYSYLTHAFTGVKEKLTGGDTGLMRFLTANRRPSEQAARNPWAAMTKRQNPNGAGGHSYERRLYDKIKGVRLNSLLPHDLFGFALEAAGQDYWLAMLTAHNLLKETAYAYRGGHPVVTEIGGAAVDPTVIFEKLVNMRPEGDKHYCDKVGPWYHMFGMFFTGGTLGSAVSKTAAYKENFDRVLHDYLGIGTSPDDPFEEKTNQWSASLSYTLNVYLPE